MPEYVRVRWRETGHHSTIAAHRFDPERHSKLKSPAVDRNGEPIPPKYKAPELRRSGGQSAIDGQQATNTQGED